MGKVPPRLVMFGSFPPAVVVITSLYCVVPSLGGSLLGPWLIPIALAMLVKLQPAQLLPRGIPVTLPGTIGAGPIGKITVRKISVGALGHHRVTRGKKANKN